MSSVNSQTIAVKRGDTWQCTWQYRDAAGDPIDLTGCSARLKLKALYTPTEVLSIGSESGELVIDEQAGDIVQTVAASVTANLLPGDYRSDLEVTWSDGTVTSTETVWVNIVEDVTV
jgi:hypothetical protein